MKGQSLIQSVLTIVVVVTSSLIVISTITPTLEEGQRIQELERAKQMMNVVDSIIRELSLEADGAIRNIRIASDFGTFTVSGVTDSISFDYDSDVEVIQSGTTQVDGNLIISAGEPMRAYEADIDADGNQDLIIENGAVLFAIKKIGSPTNLDTVNTTSIITKIENKLTGINITKPISRIYINDNINTTFGNGYTELSEKGSGISSASIKIFMNSNEGTHYEAIFTLSSSKDFVELEVRNIG